MLNCLVAPGGGSRKGGPCIYPLTVPKTIATVYLTTIPCEPNTASKPYIFGQFIPVRTTLCMVGLVLLERFCTFL